MKQEPTIVIGGGITGLCTAHYLSRRGEPVTLITRDPPGEGASGGNAGILAFGHLPLPRPGLAVKALRWMLDRRSPLYVPPRFDPALYRWFWNFHRSCTDRQVAHCMDILAPLGRLAMECWGELLADADHRCDHRPGGWLDVFLSEAGRTEAVLEGELVRDLGFDVAQCSGAGLREAEPAFGPNVLGAIHYRESASLDPREFLRGLAEQLAGQGVEIRTGEEVAELIVAKDRCLGVRLIAGDQVRGGRTVLAAGVWSTRLAETARLKIPLQAGKGYHVDLEEPAPPLNTSAVLRETYIAVTPMNGRLRLAGTVEFSGVNQDLNASRLEMLSSGASQYLSGISAARVVARGCALRPCTADGLPVLGWAPQVKDLFVATGGAKMGLTLGPALGSLAADILLDGRTCLDISSLRADRF
jgi:D-amino-acid dehydrogenase